MKLDLGTWTAARVLYLTAGVALCLAAVALVAFSR